MLKKITAGGWLCVFAFALAVASMFLPWLRYGQLQATGWQQGVWWLLLLFMYPLISSLVSGQPIKMVGIILSVVGLVGFFWYYSDKTAVVMDHTVHGASLGAWAFLLASVCMGFGSYISDPKRDVASA